MLSAATASRGRADAGLDAVHRRAQPLGARREAQAEIAGNPHLFPSAIGEGPFTAVSDCLKRVCGLAGIDGVTPHTLRHTFGSVAGDLGFSELTIRAMLGHASQNVTQDYVHIDEALKLAVERTSGEIERLLARGAAKQQTMQLAA